MQRYKMDFFPETRELRGMLADDGGKYVLYADAKAIEEERDRLKGEVAKIDCEKDEIQERLNHAMEWIKSLEAENVSIKENIKMHWKEPRVMRAELVAIKALNDRLVRQHAEMAGELTVALMEAERVRKEA